MDRNFGGVIWTNHALDRLKERGISQGDAWATFNRPDQSRYAKVKGAWVYYKTYPDERGGKVRLEVVAKQNEKKEWIILTVWSKEIYEKKPYYAKASKGKEEKGERLIFWLIKKIFNVK